MITIYSIVRPILINQISFEQYPQNNCFVGFSKVNQYNQTTNYNSQQFSVDSHNFTQICPELSPQAKWMTSLKKSENEFTK